MRSIIAAVQTWSVSLFSFSLTIVKTLSTNITIIYSISITQVNAVLVRLMVRLVEARNRRLKPLLSQFMTLSTDWKNSLLFYPIQRTLRSGNLKTLGPKFLLTLGYLIFTESVSGAFYFWHLKSSKRVNHRLSINLCCFLFYIFNSKIFG